VSLGGKRGGSQAYSTRLAPDRGRNVFAARRGGSCLDTFAAQCIRVSDWIRPGRRFCHPQTGTHKSSDNPTIVLQCFSDANFSKTSLVRPPRDRPMDVLTRKRSYEVYLHIIYSNRGADDHIGRTNERDA